MIEITAEQTKWEDILHLTDTYFSELGYKNDGFHSDIIFEGEPFIIKYDNRTVGFFSLGNSWDNGKMFRTFYVIPKERGSSVEIFNVLTDKFDIEAVLVASNDSHLISLSFELMCSNQTSFDMQAFNFTYGLPKREAEFGEECILPVTDFGLMNEMTDKQWDGMFEDKRNQFYMLKKDNTILGYGGICSMGYNRKNVDIGNYVLPQYRRMGVGRSLLIHLGKIASRQGHIPVAGCWYGNTESIATLRSAGFIPENRIFYVRLKKA